MEERGWGGKPRPLSPTSVTTLLGPKRLSQQTRPPPTEGAVMSELAQRRDSAVDNVYLFSTFRFDPFMISLPGTLP